MQFPKLYNSVAAHNEVVRAKFQARFQSPLLIVGNGPSAARPLQGSLPVDATVFRMNWFFLEAHQTYGDQVDGYFWSVDTPALHDELVRVTTRGDYSIDALFAPMHVRNERHENPLRATGLPFFDHWAIIAENPTLAREFMGRPLPTQGFQVLAFALQLGFRDIRIAGIDLYEDKKERYSYRIPKRLRNQLAAKDTTPGYESAHSYDRDISFFQTCRALFPDARLSGVTDSRFLRTYTTVPLPAKPGSAELEKATSSSVPHSVGNGRRCAFATLHSGGDFHYGVRTLARSLKSVTDVPLVVMHTGEIERCNEANVHYRQVEALRNPNVLTPSQERFAATYAKLRIFGLSEWDRLVFLDADTLVLKNIDGLFDIDEFAAAPDHGLEAHAVTFNSGVFCCQPNAETYRDILAKIHTIDSIDGGDQGFLNKYFPSPRKLPSEFNTLKRLYRHHPNLYKDELVRVLHYVGDKPWNTLAFDSEYSDLERKWLSYQTPDELIELSHRALARLAPLRPRSQKRLTKKLRKLRNQPLRFVLESKSVKTAFERAGLAQVTVERFVRSPAKFVIRELQRKRS